MQVFNMTRSIPQQDRERELQKIEDGASTKLNSKCNLKYLKGSSRVPQGALDFLRVRTIDASSKKLIQSYKSKVF